MFITSLGIFGFLSKAHVEQSSMSIEQIALVDSIEEKVIRSESKIDRWDEEIKRLLTPNSERVDIQIGNEQQQLDKLYDRIEKEKKAANDAYNQKLKTINETVTGFGSGAAKREQVDAANVELKKELANIDKKYKDEIKDLQDTIKAYRVQSETKTENIDGKIEELESKIDAEQLLQDELKTEQLVYEKEYRKLEAEVGPIKYIAELIYGDVDRGLLEDAVRWVIIILVIVFDPLAVALLIAWNDIIKRERPKRPTPIPPSPKPEPTLNELAEKKTEEVIQPIVPDAEVDRDYEKDHYYNLIGTKKEVSQKSLKEFIDETPDFYAQLADEMGGPVEYDSDGAKIEVPDDVLEQMPDGTYRKKVIGRSPIKTG
jgi:HPt (histidine-containing phosphotransfer) domain-containing protein